jgi:uncharacterized membrane protein YcaP (DUF421 family)
MISLHGTLDIVTRTVTVYLFLLVGVRLAGKREIGQLMPFDFVLLLVLSNAVQNAMVGPDNSLAGGLIAAGTLLVLTLALNALGREWPRIRRVMVGAPTVLISHGMVMHRNLDREHITQEDLDQVLREHECSSPEEVDLATLEIDGNVSVIRREKDGPMPHYVRTRRRLRRQRQTS